MSEAVTVPILPATLHRDAFLRNHDAPTAGHQGFEKTLERLRQEVYILGQYGKRCATILPGMH